MNYQILFAALCTVIAVNIPCGSHRNHQGVSERRRGFDAFPASPQVEAGAPFKDLE